jgi:hypothetical protein
MSNDPLLELERELVGAARRLADARAPRPARRRRAARRNLGALATAAASGAVVAAVVAVILLAGQGSKAPVGAAASPRQQLIDILAPLRRPQTPMDVSPALRSLLAFGPASPHKPTGQGIARPNLTGPADWTLVRLATVTPWGFKVVLVPMGPVPASSPLARGGEILSVCELGRNEASCVGGSTAAELKQDGLVSTASSGPDNRVLLVVPDGVARVALESRRGPGALTVSADVHGNVAAFARMPFPYGQAVLQGGMTWYGADGRVLKRIVPHFAKLDLAGPRAGFGFGSATSSGSARGRATSGP